MKSQVIHLSRSEIECITVAILEEDLTLESSFQTIFSHFFLGGGGGQNKRISVGFFSVYSIARKTVGVNPTHFHINYFL